MRNIPGDWEGWEGWSGAERSRERDGRVLISVQGLEDGGSSLAELLKHRRLRWLQLKLYVMQVLRLSGIRCKLLIRPLGL
ncbi:hypothetical protein RRG08_032963 [Elysia crispata]|uniref:Uncharacterized protein n=1 Tax=Elysia crispata TaxID=231223 RepID=A0AAE0YSB9_9GAST|nr:hypothetical protein RRG08_032963 [Elysia crispata]